MRPLKPRLVAATLTHLGSQRLSKLAKWVWITIGSISAFFGLSGLGSMMLENWLRSRGYIEHPENAVSRLIAWIADPAQSWWLLPVSVALIAAPCLYVIWRLVTIWSAKRRIKLEALGKDMIRAAGAIRLRQGGFRNPWPANFEDRRGQLDAIFIRANNLWIRTPGK